MTPNRVAVALEKYKAQIPAGYESLLRSDLEKADDRCMDEFMFLPIRRKGATVALSILFGHLGLDHFYLGNKRKGFFKLGLFVLVGICSGSIATGPTVLLALSLAVWWFIDIFKNYKRTKYNNFYSLSAYLYNHQYKELPEGATSTATLNYTPTVSTAAKPAAKTSAAKPTVKSTAKAKASAKSSNADVIQLPPSSAKYSPVKTAPKPTVKAEEPPKSIDAAMNAYAKSSSSELSVDDLADLASANAILSGTQQSTVAAPTVETKASAPKKLDLTFSNITVNASLAKDLGFEDFDEPTTTNGGARRGR